MTGDELERAIDFILKSRARAEARIERNEEQLARLAEHALQMTQQSADFQKRQDAIEEAHADLVRTMQRYLETQDRINKSLRAADIRQARISAALTEALRASEESRHASEESLHAAMTKLAARQERTEATVDRLSHRVEALVKLAEEQRNGGQ